MSERHKYYFKNVNFDDKINKSVHFAGAFALGQF